MHVKKLCDVIPKPQPDFNQLLKVLKRDGKPGYVPFYELFANIEIMEELLEKKVPDRAATVEFYYKAGYDYVPVWPGINMVLGSLIDTHCDYPIKDWSTFDSYKWPEVESIQYTEFETIAPILPAGMKMIGQTFGIFEAAQTLVGYENLCFFLNDEPELVEAIFEKLGVLYEAMYSGMASIDQVGALVVSDDMGFKTGTMISPDQLRRFVLPYHKKLADIAHGHGKPCILHSCGQLSGIMDDIINYVGIDAKHSYEDQIMPVMMAKKKYGDRIAILGGYDIDRLCRNTVNEVEEYTGMLVNELGKLGGYALGTGNSVAAFVPVDNYLAMLEVGWRSRL